MKAVRRGPRFVSNERDVILDLTRRSALLGSFLILLTGTFFLSPVEGVAQSSTYRVWGDVKIDDSKADTPGPATLTVILYDPSGSILGRQTVSNGGRYRFNVTKSGGDGQFDSRAHEIAIESESGEITRTRVVINGPSGSDFRQDFEFEWKSKVGAPKRIAGVISAADVYDRSTISRSLLQKAKGAVEKKNYDQAAMLLGEIVDKDKLDFQAWTLLGTVYLVQEKSAEAEKAYLSAIEAKPTYALALLNLGRLRASQKKYEQAIEPLTQAVEAQPQSGEANLLLGEAYLQIKKGSKAIGYLNQASQLGRPEAHLRLGWLYDAAGMKDKAANEYAEFLKKKPDYSDRKKLEEYIRANKKV